MAQLSGFWNTGGSTGDQQTAYTESHWSTAAKILAGCAGFEGVAPNFKNALAGTVTGANTVSINTGGAVVDGKWFHNDSALSVNIPTAVGSGNTRIDRIVLRCDWSGYDVSIYRIAGTDAASPSAPAITQTGGTTYDIKLYQALVTTAGTVTLTDERTLALPKVDDVTLEIASGALQVKEIPNSKLADHFEAIYLKAKDHSVELEIGDGVFYFTIPSYLDGTTLVDFDIAVYTPSTSGLVTVQLHNVTDAVDVLSTKATIDANEYNSMTASTQPVINSSNSLLSAGDRMRIDIDGVGTGSAGLDIMLEVDKA